MKNLNRPRNIIATISGLTVIIFVGIPLIVFQGMIIGSAVFCFAGFCLVIFPWVSQTCYVCPIIKVTNGFRPDCWIDVNFPHNTIKLRGKIKKYGQIVNAEFPDGKKTTVRADWAMHELVLVTKNNQYLFTGVKPPWKK